MRILIFWNTSIIPHTDKLVVDVDLNDLAGRTKSKKHIEIAEERIKLMQADPNIKPIETSFRAYDKNGELLVSYFGADPDQVRELQKIHPGRSFDNLCEEARALDSCHSPMTVSLMYIISDTDRTAA